MAITTAGNARGSGFSLNAIVVTTITREERIGFELCFPHSRRSTIGLLRHLTASGCS